MFEFIQVLLGMVVSMTAGAGFVVLGWWMCLITMKTEYVPLPSNESRAEKKARKLRKAELEKAVTADDDSYNDVLNTDGEEPYGSRSNT